MKKIILLASILILVLTACKKDDPSYLKFTGEYDLKSSGSINFFIGDTVFTNEPGLAIIKKGDSDDEIFIYIETNYVTSIAPLGTYAKAKVEGNKYTMEAKNLSINIDLGGTPLTLPFNVDASGTLTGDDKILTSEVVFTGGIKGTMTSIGTKK